MDTKGSKSPRNTTARVLGEIPRSGIRDFFDIVSERDDVISLSIGEPDFDAPWHIREACVFALERGATSYTSNRGLFKLRRQLADYVGEQFGVAYNPDEEILVTVGVSEALDLAMRALLDPGDEVLYHSPAYVSYGPVIRLAGGSPVAVPTDMQNDFRINPDALEERVTERTKILLLNYPNNPTGATLDRGTAERLAEFVREHDLLLVADDIYSELCYDDDPVGMVSLPGMRERTVLLHGFSKAWAMTGLRMGYACARPEIIEAMMKIHQYTIMCAPTPSQEAALEALSNPGDDVGRMRDDYRRRRNYLYRRLRETGLACVRPRGAFYAFPRIGDLGLSSREFALRLLDEQAVAVVPGTAFGEVGEGFVRCSFATAMEDLKIACDRIAAFVDTVR